MMARLCPAAWAAGLRLRMRRPPLVPSVDGELPSPIGVPTPLAPKKLTDLLSPSMVDDDVSAVVDGGDGRRRQ